MTQPTFAKSPCINDDTLSDFSAGKLTDPVMEVRVADHLAECMACETRFAALPDDPLIGVLCDPSPLSDELHDQLRLDGKREVSLQSTLATEGVKVNVSAAAAVVDEEMPVELGGYFVVKRLGKGGFAEVFLAKSPVTGELVAIKAPRPERLNTQEAREAFLREARIMIELAHPNIVPVLEVRELEDGRCIIVMEYVPGETLSELISHEPISPKRAVTLAIGIAKAIDFANRNGFRHRDVKPSNILLGEAGTPILTDFGLAIEEQEQYLHAAEYAGTLPYMSPEQVSGRADELDVRSDLWSLGVVLYQMLSRRRPFESTSPAQLRRDIAERPHQPVSNHNPEISRDLEAICERCLQKRPGDRFATATRLIEELEALHAPAYKTLAWALAAVAVVVLAAASLMGRGEPVWAQPQEIIWTPMNDQVDVRPHYDRETRSFNFATHAESLFGVSSWEADELTLRARFTVASKYGQAGMFWGLATITGDPRIDMCCWSLQAGRNHAMDRCEVIIRQRDIGPSSGRHLVFDSFSLMRIPFQEPDDSTYDIELTVDRWAVKRIVINEVVLLDEPVKLEPDFARKWHRLKDTKCGIFGSYGSFSFDLFDATL